MSVDLPSGSFNHPLSREIASLQSAVAHYQHEAHSASVKLQRFSLNSSVVVEKLHALEHENANLRRELEVHRSHPDVSPQPNSIQVQELSLALRRLSDKLDITESALLEKSAELVNANSERDKARLAADNAYAVAIRLRGELEACKAKAEELDVRVKAAEDERSLSDAFVEQLSKVVGPLEDGILTGEDLVSTRDQDEKLNTTLANVVTSMKMQLRETIQRSGLETEKLQTEVGQLLGELETTKATLDAERKAALDDKRRLALAQLELHKLKTDDHSAAMMVSRYMKFSQSSADILHSAMENLKARHSATLSSHLSRLHALEDRLANEQRQCERLRHALDELGEDMSREAYGRRREISLRLGLLSREERLVEVLKRCLVKGHESLAKKPSAIEDVTSAFKRFVYSVAKVVSVADKTGLSSEDSDDFVSRIIAAEAAVKSLTTDLQREQERRVALDIRLAKLDLDALQKMKAEKAVEAIALSSSGQHTDLRNGVAGLEHTSKRVNSENGSEELRATSHSSGSSDASVISSGDSCNSVDTGPSSLHSPAEVGPLNELRSKELPSLPEPSPVPSPRADSQVLGEDINEGSSSVDTGTQAEGEGNLEKECLRNEEALSSPTGEVGPTETSSTAESPEFSQQATDQSNAEVIDVSDITIYVSEASSPLENGILEENTAPVSSDDEPVACSHEQQACSPAPTSDDNVVQIHVSEEANDFSPVWVESSQGRKEAGTNSIDFPSSSVIDDRPESHVGLGALHEELVFDDLQDTTSASPPEPSSKHSFIFSSLSQVEKRYDGLQRSFRDCHISLEQLKEEIEDPSSTLHSALRSAIERLDDYCEDSRVELEIRVADEERITKGYEALLTVPGALSNEVNESEVVQQIESFANGTSDTVRRSIRALEHKLEDLEHDIAVVKKALHDQSLSNQSSPEAHAEELAKPTSGWSSWTGSILSSSRPSSPAPTFGAVITAPRLRHSSSFNKSSDPLSNLGLRIAMPSAVQQLPSTFSQERLTPRPRASSSMFSLGLGGGVGSNNSLSSPRRSSLALHITSSARSVAALAGFNSGSQTVSSNGSDDVE